MKNIKVIQENIGKLVAKVLMVFPDANFTFSNYETFLNINEPKILIKIKRGSSFSYAVILSALGIEHSYYSKYIDDQYINHIIDDIVFNFAREMVKNCD